ncbi:unnamed protein product [Cylicostephanus goldi]|uniref:RING finger protein 121 n=1 Tax=Cylicostephanus goldi TaxID=71465 RepID=A0A3P6Q0W4_CYLGO|nr:unnamed protein product [Cylicostephanus goldi]
MPSYKTRLPELRVVSAMGNRDENVVLAHRDEFGGVVLQHDVGPELIFIVSILQMRRTLSEQEEWAIEHAKLHEKHKGHEQMHLEMMLILIVTLVVAQVFLVQWKKRHFKSYQLCTLLGMWLIPVYVCLSRSWYRFLVTWLIYTICSTWIWRKSTEDHISGTTPR